MSHANLHFALERLRDAAISSGQAGPRVLIVGPENAGKTSLAKLLTAYATRSGRPAVTVNLDPREGLLTIPGTFSAASFATILDVEAGWGSSPTNAPTHVPVKLPLVYFLGAETLEEDTTISKPTVSRLALSMLGRVQDDARVRPAGCIIDSPGSISQGQPNYDLMQHVISEFQGKSEPLLCGQPRLTEALVTVIVVLGSERLYSDLLRRNNGQSTVGGDTITVIKLDRSGGCVDRDEAFRQQCGQVQIKNYFFGDAKTTLSPHTQQVDFAQLAIFKLIRQSPGDETSSFLPGGYESNDVNAASTIERIASPTLQLQNALLAILHADPSDSPEEIRDSSVKGFVYVVEVDELKKKVKVLAPISGRLLDNPLLWSQYPEASPDLVG